MNLGLPRRWHNALGWLPGVLISAVALFFVFKLASWQDLTAAFYTMRPLNVFVAVILTCVSLATRALAWWNLLGKKASLSKSFFIINEGYLLNNLFPLRAGEIGRAVFMGKACNLGAFRVLSTIVIERAFDLAFAAGLLLATLPLAIGVSWAKPIAISTLFLVMAGLLALYLVARFSLQIQTWLEKKALRGQFIRKWILPRIESLLNGLGALTKPSQFFVSLFWIMMSWVIWITLYYILLVCIAPHAPFWWAAFADGMLALGVAIPSAPAALGVYEATTVGALSILGITPSTALAFAIFTHFLNFAITGIFGFVGFLKEGRSLRTLLAEIQIWKQNTSA